LKRDERTVRRWEKEGLPVHRHTHKKQASVYAFKPEIDVWWKNGQSRPVQNETRFPRRRPAWVIYLLVFGLAVLTALNLSGLRQRFGKPVSSPQIRSLAVLPLENLTGDPSQEYFVDGITDALITDLAQVSGLQVISRTSAMQYKGRRAPIPEVAKRLNVDAVVEGTVARSGSRVRINAQLIDGRTDRHLWAKGYERELSEILALQHEVARTIVVEIEVKLTPQEQRRLETAHHVDPEAYQLYLKGRYFWNKRTQDTLQKAITYFQQALEKDPDLASAYAAIADCYVVLGAWNLNALPPTEAFNLAKFSALKALEINADSAEAYTELSSVKALYDWDWRAAEKESQHAIQLNPSYSLAHQRYASHLGQVARFDESIAESRVAQQLDPLSLMAGTSVGERFYWARRYVEAVKQIHGVLEMDPNFVPAHFLLGQVREQEAMLPEAIAEFKKTLGNSDRNAVVLAALGHAYAVSGQRTESLRILEELRRLSTERYVSAYGPAIIYVGLGEKSNALKSLEKAYQEHSSLLALSKVDPRLDPLRSEPRFETLLRRIGLAEMNSIRIPLK